MTAKRLLLRLYLGIGRATNTTFKVVLAMLAVAVAIGVEGLGIILKLGGSEPDMGWWMALYIPRWTVLIAIGCVAAIAALVGLCEGIYYLHTAFIRWCES